MKTDYTRKGWTLRFDDGECYEGGTPALVIAPNGDTGTYGCVLDTGLCGETQTPGYIMAWLDADRFQDEVIRLYDKIERTA